MPTFKIIVYDKFLNQEFDCEMVVENGEEQAKAEAIDHYAHELDTFADNLEIKSCTQL